MRVAWFGRLLTAWAGPNAWVRRLSYRNREWVLVGYRYVCRGRIVKKWEEDGAYLAACEIACENESGAITDTGYAEVELPARR